MKVEVRLLGGFAVLCDGITALDARWRPAKAAAIVKILALRRDHTLHRDRLIDILWPDSDPASGSNSLYKNLHQLREALTRAGAPRDVVRLDRSVLSLGHDVSVDVDAFRVAAQLARREPSEEALSAALRYYEGDLLPDDPYEEYAALAREETRMLALLLRLRFGELHLDHGRLEPAIEQFREALTMDAASEEAHRGLMRAFDADGRRGLALRQYERCSEELAKDLGAIPSLETKALADQIRRAGSVEAVVKAAVDEPEQAGDEARRAFAWDDAISHYREAIERLHAAGRDDLREAKLWMKLADASAPIVTNVAIPEYCRRAVDLAQSAGSFETLAKALLRFQDATDTVPGNNAGHREAAELIEAALREAPPGDSPGKVLLLAASARPLAAALRPNGSRHVTGRSSVAGERDAAIEQRLRDAVEMARRVGDRNVLAIAITRLRNYIVSPDTLPERLELSREMVAVTTEPNHLRWEFEAHLFRQEDLLEVGDIDGARIEARAMRRLGESQKSDAILAVAWSMQATHDIADGALAEANRTLFQSLDLDQKVGMNSNAPGRHLIQLVMLRWHEGRINELEDDLRRIVDRVPEDASMRALLALTFAETGRVEDARVELEAIVSQQTVDRLPKDHLWWLTTACMSHVAAATESTEIARDLYACLLPYAARNAATWSAISFGSASLLLARLAASLGDVAPAQQHYEDALAFNDQTRQRTWAARARYHFAQLLMLRGIDEDRACELARVALADAKGLGMAQLKLQCEALLAAPSRAAPEVRYTTTADGVRIAYTDEGEGPPLVHMSQLPWNHLQLEYELPEWGAWHDALGAGRRYIRYDGRGRGLSDREGQALAVETEVMDLEAVIEATGVDQFDLYSGLQSSMTALAYAARYPEKVRKLALWNAYAANPDVMDTTMARSGREMIHADYAAYCDFGGLTTIGNDNAEAARTMSRILQHSADVEFVRTWFTDEYMNADVSGVLGEIVCPVLIVENRALPVGHEAVRAAHRVAQGLRDAHIYPRETPILAPYIDDREASIEAIRGFFDAPVVRYTTTADGARIAYTDEGEGFPLVHMSQVPWNHLQLEWEMPEWRAWHEALGKGRRYIRYDGRGRGLSDRTRNECRVETEMLDLLAVVDELGLQRFDLFSGIHACLTAFRFAAEHPDRVRRLALWFPYARGEDYMNAGVRQQAGAMMYSDWALFCQYVAHATLDFEGNHDEEQCRRVADIWEGSATPGFEKEVLERYLPSDVSEFVPRVRTPSLILYDPRYDAGVPSAAVEEITASMPNAIPTMLDRQCFMPQVGDSSQALAAIRGFLDAPTQRTVQHTTTSDGARIAYIDEGEGTPLVHLSQLPWNHLQLERDMPEWNAWHEALAEGRRYIRYDGRGRGLSDRTRNECTVETEILDLLAVVDEQGLRQFDLFAGFGASLTALRFAADYPDRVRRMVLWAPITCGDTFMSAGVRQQAGAQLIHDWPYFCQFVIHTTLQLKGRHDEDFCQRMAKVYESSAGPALAHSMLAEYLAGSDVSEILPHVTSPALILYDEIWEPAVRLADIQRLNSRLSGSALQLVDGGCFPFADEYTETLLLIRQFLDAPAAEHTAPQAPAEAAGV